MTFVWIAFVKPFGIFSFKRSQERINFFLFLLFQDNSTTHYVEKQMQIGFEELHMSVSQRFRDPFNGHLNHNQEMEHFS
jgi:hypothetical protein